MCIEALWTNVNLGALLPRIDQWKSMKVKKMKKGKEKVLFSGIKIKKLIRKDKNGVQVLNVKIMTVIIYNCFNSVTEKKQKTLTYIFLCISRWTKLILNCYGNN